MAVTDAGSTPLTFTNLPIGVQVTKITDTSADWASVPNLTYFYDKRDGLVHFKNSSGVVLELFSAGGLTNFTEAANSSAPNATVPVNSLTATGAATNIDAAFIPKGTGAILAAIPDSTATGGNKRGTRAVDLQTQRALAGQVASGNNSVITGGYDNTASAQNTVVSGGYANNASAERGMILGGDNNTASGAVSVAIGGSNTASGTFAVSLGYANTSSSTASVGIGWSNISSNTRSIAIGESCTASGINSVSIGQSNTANATNSTALGYQSSALGIIGRQVYASGQEATAGDAQSSKFVLHERTTGNTATTLTTNSSAASTNNQVILSNQSAYRFKGTIIGKQSGMTKVAAWDIDGLIVRGANAASTTLSLSNVTLVQNTSGWGTPTLAADTTNGGLQVQVIGDVGTNIQWTAVIETTEVIYA